MTKDTVITNTIVIPTFYWNIDTASVYKVVKST